MRRIACIHWKSDDCRLQPANAEQIADRCRRFSPLVGREATDSDCLLLDITGLAHLFGGEAALVEAMVHELAPFGLPVRVTVADTVGAAWAAAAYGSPKSEIRNPKPENPRSHAEYGDKENGSPKSEIRNPKPENPTEQPAFCNSHSSFLIVPPGEAAPLLASLPVEALRLPAETVRVLRELGLRTIGQLESLPREGFLSRFGPVLLRRLDQAFGRVDEPVRASAALPRFAARWSGEYSIARREMIEGVVERLIGRVACMLAQCGRGALRLECRLALEIHNPNSDVRNLSLSVGLFEPTVSAAHLFALVQLQFERLRIPAPVEQIDVIAALTAPLEPIRQATLFDLGQQGGKRHGAAREARGPHDRQLASLVERLSSRLGSAAVLGVRLRPEAQPELAWHYDPLVGNRRRRAQPRAERTESVTLPPRPLRLLPRPRLLDCIPGDSPALFAMGGTPASDSPPLRFRLAGREHQIVRHWGPERIETGWWRGQAVGRDYFRVETTSGSRYWLFRRLRDGKWFLHGMFE
ncbi:MAG: DNA polymerase Y family protein [Thermoguttaceae bacterium]